MNNKNNKYDKPLAINMEFDEMMQRISKVEKSKVETNIKRYKKKKEE
jgi:hypothetical protein